MTALILDPDALLTVRQAAKMLTLAESTVYDWIYQGRLGSKKIGRCRRVIAADVKAVLDEAPTTERIQR